MRNFPFQKIGFKNLDYRGLEADSFSIKPLLDLHAANGLRLLPRQNCKVWVIIGTRPELIKMAPIVETLKADSFFETTVINTGQHQELVDTLYGLLGVKPDYDCELMSRGQSLSELYANAISRLDKLLLKNRPDMILVQGDTTSAAAAAMVGFLNIIPVGHVEAGLRTFNLHSPFPEELNRILIGQVTSFHFAPSEIAYRNLVRSGIDPKCIFLVGNTVVDSIHHVLGRLKGFETPMLKDFFTPNGRKKVLLTLHRRENQQGHLDDFFRTIADVAQKHKERADILFPMHFTPLIREKGGQYLSGATNITLTEPIEYFDFIQAVNACDFIISDSGGIQEEALVLSKPILILRDTTERTEVIESGLGRLIGSDMTLFKTEFDRLVLEPGDEPQNKVIESKPYGTGNSAQLITGFIRDFFRDGAHSHQFDLSVIVPCFNQERHVANVMELLVKTAKEASLNAEILFIDDHSTDKTYSVACNRAWHFPNVLVLTKTFPRGLGNAIRFGLNYIHADTVAIVSGDNTDDISVLPLLYEKVSRENYDLAIASRYLHRKTSRNMPWIYKLVSALFRGLSRLMIGIPLKDQTSPYRAFNWKILKNIGIESTGFEILPEITFKAWFYRKKVVEVDAEPFRINTEKSNFVYAKAAPGYFKIFLKALIARLTKSWPYIDW